MTDQTEIPALTPAEYMAQMIERLKEERGILEQSKYAAVKIIEAAKATQEYKDYTREAELAEKAMEILEEEIRKFTVETYFKTGEKKPFEKVEVKMFKTVTVTDEAKAREWCLHNFTPALKLDTKTFEKAAKEGTVPAELATVTEEPRAQISAKL